MKDPAFLLYYQDFLVGSMFMSNEQVGAYIRILCHQADKGSITKEHMLSICIDETTLNTVLNKFVLDFDGTYYNVRLREEVEKRRKYAESRRKNAKSEKAYAKHMEDEIEDEDIEEKNKKFVKPTPKEIEEYSTSIGYPINGDYFIDTYEKKDWMIGKNKMKNWKAAVRTWKMNNYSTPKPVVSSNQKPSDLILEIQERLRRQKNGDA